MTTATLDVSLEQLQAAALRLDSSSRTRLAYCLLDSVDDDSPASVNEDDRRGVHEAAQRLLDLRAGRATERDGAEVMRAAFEQFP